MANKIILNGHIWLYEGYIDSTRVFYKCSRCGEPSIRKMTDNEMVVTSECRGEDIEVISLGSLIRYKHQGQIHEIDMWGMHKRRKDLEIDWELYQKLAQGDLAAVELNSREDKDCDNFNYDYQ